MSTVVTMSQTVADLTNGQTYCVRSRTAEKLIAASQASKSTLRSGTANVLPAKTGKRDA